MLLRNYLKIALRSMRKHIGHSALNLFGFAVSMAACVLIALFVLHEYKVDSFHTKAEQIYRLDEIQSFPGITPQHVALSMYPMGPTLKSDYPEVLEFARVAGGPGVINLDDELRTLEDPIRVDPSFFALFDFPILDGDPATELESPNTVALTESMALSLYGTADAVGREFRVNDESYHVVGILGNSPAPSHLRFDAVFSMKDLDDEENMERWGNNWLVTYLLLDEGADVAGLEAKFPDYKRKYMGETQFDYYELYLQPLLDVHLGSAHITHDYRNWQKFDRRYVQIFVLLALVVLLIAGINFTNLTAARAASRAREVGVRKSVGAQRVQLALQFIGESMIMVIASMVIGFVLAWLSLPLVNALSQRELHLGTLFQPELLTGIAGMALLIGLLAGFYPALILSGFQTTIVLKGGIDATGRKSLFRNVLVVSQFAIAMALIVGTLIATRQLNFMQSRDIGFQKDHVLLVPLSRQANQKYLLLKELLSEEPDVLDVTASNQRLGNNLHQWGTRAESERGDVVDLSISNLNVDYNFLDFYRMELREGRWFSEDRGSDFGAARVVNEAMVEEMGWTEPVGKQIGFGGDDTLGTVIGVARDFNFNSLHHAVEPLVMSVQDFGYSELSIRIDPTRTMPAIEAIRRIWSEVATDRPFEYSFLDDHLNEMYRADMQVSAVISVVTGLAILIACLGLLGLAAITTEQRTKELGIRKALGATAPQLAMLLSRDFTRLILLAFVIATPIAFFALRSWLSSYAYRIDLGPGVFVFAGVITLFIALATVSYRAIKAASVNPIDTLRYE